MRIWEIESLRRFGVKISWGVTSIYIVGWGFLKNNNNKYWRENCPRESNWESPKSCWGNNIYFPRLSLFFYIKKICWTLSWEPNILCWVDPQLRTLAWTYVEHILQVKPSGWANPPILTTSFSWHNIFSYPKDN